MTDRTRQATGLIGGGLLGIALGIAYMADDRFALGMLTPFAHVFGPVAAAVVDGIVFMLASVGGAVSAAYGIARLMD